MFNHNQKNKSVIAALLALSMVTLFSGVLFFRQEVASVRLSFGESFASASAQTQAEYSEEEGAQGAAFLALILLIALGLYASFSSRTPFPFFQITTNPYVARPSDSFTSQTKDSWPIRGPSL